MKTVLVTGSSGLIGSEVCAYFARELDCRVHGIDNNQRAVFFGPQGDTRWNEQRLRQEIPGFVHHELDIRDRTGVLGLLKELRPSVIVHTAAQPSHDRAAAIPFDDFDTNAVGTLNLLEAARQSCPESPFVHMSTNKVYGDAPNRIPLVEGATRWDYADPAYANGIPETFTIDQSKHSLFGASKVAADVMVQEYGRYFGLPTCCLRGGCLTGPNHTGVELHGFLSYLVKCNLEGREYKIFGYKGKQVRDNIHSLDVARFMAAFVEKPRVGEVYNLGGGKANSCSILEAFKITESYTGNAQVFNYVDENRIGDHICYYSDLRKMRAHYPGWDITKSLEQTIGEIVEAWRQREGNGKQFLSSAMSQLPVTIYTPESPLRHPGVFLRAMFRDLLASRELAWRLFIRDLSAQYRQTFLGYIWAFLPPLVASATFIYLNSQGIIRIEGTRIPYPAFAMMGTLLWQVFVDAIQSPAQSVGSAKSMLSKINFPREAILLGGFYMVLFNFCIRLVLVIVVMILWQVTPSATLLMFPVAMAGLLICGYAIGLAITPLSMLYGDISRGIPIITQFWMLLTPVVYPARTHGLAGWLATWNPVSPLITTARETLTGQPLSLLPAFGIVFIVSGFVAFMGLVGFRLTMPILIERMGG